MTIIASLRGGLGNQLFQYAAARSLAQKHFTDFYLDDSWFFRDSMDTKREIELNNLGIAYKSSSLLSDVPIASSRFFRIFSSFSNWRVVKELPSVLFKDFFELPDFTYLDGYWQGYVYSQDIIDQLSFEIFSSSSSFLSSQSLCLRNTITSYSSQSVSVHVRRGDYSSVASTNAYHGLISIEYYKKCFEFFRSTLDSPVFFVFSDDIDWCRKNILLDCIDVRFVDCNSSSLDSWQDLLLMSCCAHHILANSTFSWWSAWLKNATISDLPHQFVLYPDNWFVNVNAYALPHLFPKAWISVT